MFANKENLALKLYGLLKKQYGKNDITIGEWRLLGQEQNGCQLVSWFENESQQFKIGSYTHKNKFLDTLHTFTDRINIIQASVNITSTALVYVVKETDENDKKESYIPYFLLLGKSQNEDPIKLQEPSNKQIMVQFIYGKRKNLDPETLLDKFILLTHLESIKIFPVTLVNKIYGENNWVLNDTVPKPDVMVKTFLWAQWDCVNQVLYYIHNRSSNQSFAEGEERKSPTESTPSLSALQFHGDQPHETVLNIPLNLPQVPTSTSGPACGLYEDNPVPLRVHDCSIDLLIVSDSSGVVCICHHYLFKTMEDSETSQTLEDSTELKETGVNLTYSVTLLHHGVVLHCVLPGLDWDQAKALRPSFTLYGANHLLVNIPNMYIHMLDIGLDHEPCCHFIVTQPNTNTNPTYTPLVGWGANIMIDRFTLDVLTLEVKDKDICETFKSDCSVENKMSIMHYLIQHSENYGFADELIAWSIANPDENYGSLLSLMQEYLLATSYITTKRQLPQNSNQITRILPYTLNTKLAEVKIGDSNLSMKQEKLWNTSVVLLSPRQRISQLLQDVWTRLWQYQQYQCVRFRQQQVVDKLKLSLECYQPEVVSRCTTPLSPAAPMPPPRRSTALPFHELDVCTASKQEHIMAANVRELNMYAMRCSATDGTSGPLLGDMSGSHWGMEGARWGTEVGTRHASAQLLAARELCAAICTALHLPATSKGTQLVDELNEDQRYVLLKTLEQYYLAADLIAFPLPQGFTSFFSYLGYRTLDFSDFLQYVHRNVFELQIDVLKAVISDGDDSSKEAISRKLRVLQLAGDARARRALAAWTPATQLRARRHAHTLLRGNHDPPRRSIRQASVPVGETIKPLDTFLDLLTAKASLNELDFNLIIEATLQSIGC